MRLGMVSAFANCGRAVAHVRGSYVPTLTLHCSKQQLYSITSSARAYPAVAVPPLHSIISHAYSPTSVVMTSPNNSQRSPLNFLS